ncbi:tetratricopeptide repeat protein [Tuwongella immobilis]|uniref:Ancillary SecYEG translocon subunit/Cell division coordinator CpoB TPR domain-containing protein n=1 Tax=Tuwongella immobilis TaxID=692036 RepID=A0A6C2YR22_9BACT|nr:tetratricopeptide repeat protein [Tuwongella immobilis]VIP04100.1 membrane protein : Uncharacterized protein OS=Planctomyces maris DSM 8797 GN=PM8797T_16358 PE=4 SV=1: TPR_21: TPR_2: TPR_8 [Tuwongella immobilis]VTS05567.1 membrane protein : Uncharacterized protein OS=Planctomyces maris DSM 8797 GN=PM8797T_16358 PE=4 SV=1: TPR_21: TPR_2: TPR_8 [Tuwongella immobilis]
MPIHSQAVLVNILAMLAVTGVLIVPVTETDRGIAPYFHLEIWLVYLVAMLPISSLLALVLPFLRRITYGIAVLSILLTGLVVIPETAEIIAMFERTNFVIGCLIRGGIAFVFMLGLMSALGDSLPRWTSPRNVVAWVMGLLMATALPTLLVIQRSEELVRESVEASLQSRWATAYRSFAEYRRLAGDNSEAAQRQEINYSSQVKIVKQMLEQPLPPQAPEWIRIVNARMLAQLNRTDEALAILQKNENPQQVGEIEQLRGTIAEQTGDWATAKVAFAKAIEWAETNPEAATSKMGLQQGLTGLAYAQRKSGDYVAAEQTYRRLLEASPTPETYFLLALFYEDSQQAELAAEFAQKASDAKPDRFRDAARKLQARLRTQQVGCLLVEPTPGGESAPSSDGSATLKR